MASPTEGLKKSGPPSKTSQKNAKYDPPSKGPFKCGTCEYYSNHSCSIVEGKIEPEGCCILWEKK